MSGSPFDLDQFAPPPVRFRLRGVDYVVDGDPDVDTVARMLRIENNLDTEDGDSVLAAAEEARALLLEMIQQHDPSVAGLKISVREILVVFPLIMRGPSVAAAVADALLHLRTDTAQPPATEDSPVATPDDTAPGGDRDGDGPLVSVKSSPAVSSRSGSATGSPEAPVAGFAV